MNSWQLPRVSLGHEGVAPMGAHRGRDRGTRQRVRRRSERGAALLLVLWVFVALFVVVLDFAASMRDDGRATVNFADETQAYYIALAGLNRAVYDVLVQLEEDPDAFSGDGEYDDYAPSDDEDIEEDYDEYDETVEDVSAESDGGGLGEEAEEKISGDGKWHSGLFGGGQYGVRMVDESGKISLNRASEALLMRVVRRLVIGGNATEGTSVAEERDVEAVVHAILDWRDSDDMKHLNGAEGDYYASLPHPYPIKDGPFDSVDELLLVKGITPELFYGTDDRVGLGSLFSVFNRSGWINVMRAPAPVLRVLFDVDAEGAEELILEREESPFGFVGRAREMMKPIDPELERHLRGGMSSMVTVEAHGRSGERSVARVAAIVDLSDSFDGARVFRWFDRVPAGWDTGGMDPTDAQVLEDSGA